MSIIERIAEVFGIRFEDDENEEQEQVEAPVSSRPKESPKVTFNTISRVTQEIPQSYIIFEPKSYDECQTMADELKKGHYIIVKYGFTTTSLARCIFFFMEGCIYALDGSKEKISNEIFLYLPKGTDVKKEFSINTKLKTPW